MSTYRERREARAEQLRGWSASRAVKSDQAAETAHDAVAGIPFGQPILVGHHSQRRHERALERSWNAMGAAVEHGRKAEEMADKADEIERQANAAIYDDDPDAIERLQAKLATMEARREQMKAANAAYRKEHRAELKAMGSAYQRGQAVPFPSYSITNLGGNISRTKDRLKRLEREREHGPRDRHIIARFTSECADCGAELVKGTVIRYNRQQGARCLTCESGEPA